MNDHDAPSLDRSGYTIVPNVVDHDVLRELDAPVSSVLLQRAGARNLLSHDWCRCLALRLARHPAIAGALPEEAVAISCTLFDKRAERNWSVGVHQDLSVPVARREDVPGWRAWNRKQGTLFVQPPDDLLGQLLAVRVHLDDSTADNGPLRVVPGTHRLRRITEENALQLRDEIGEAVCVVPAGGALLMRPLLLHASGKAASGQPRRVLHFVFGPPRPHGSLSWPEDAMPCGAFAGRSETAAD